mmetsp:Transcript_28063/g.59244  ORF Transcript_28063/g.59244 Transcript_28063/m.59244 type:complete len:122 (-) Transcript_28063:356-721(-)
MADSSKPPQYNDKYITLTNTTLILKTYYFPIGTSKIIPLSNIERIWIGTDPELGLQSIWKKKSWGMAFSNVWWNCRFGREFDTNNDHNFVVALKDHTTWRCGFSVEDPEAFRSLVGEYIQK